VIQEPCKINTKIDFITFWFNQKEELIVSYNV